MLHETDEFRRGAKTRQAREFSSLAKNDKGGNAMDPQLPCELRMVFRIDLQYEGLSLHLGGGFFHFWRDHFTGPAPISPKVDEDGHSCF